jgi:GT2 family glycosyltransferase
MQNAKTDIVILTFNNSKYIELCLDRIRKNTDNYQLILIDNGSTDGTREIIDKIKKPEDVVIFNEKNLGCGPARNQGARLGTSELIAFVDSDVVVVPGWLESMKLVYDSEESGLVGIMSHQETGRPFGLSPMLVAGFCTLHRRDIFTKLGGYDDEMFFGYEDNDYCFKVVKEGMKLRFSPLSVLHFGSLSISPTPELAEEIEKSRLYFNEKWQANYPSYLKR